MPDQEISILATTESEEKTENHDGKIVGMLSKWFDKPLSELPKEQREMAKLHIPRWPKLSAAERRACAIASPMVELDAMRRSFNKVLRERAGERDFESRASDAKLLDDRCIELAQTPELKIADWIELTGIGTGEIGPYLVTRDSVGFVQWEPEEIRRSPPVFQVDMLRRNEQEPLKFPCTPAGLLDFIDSELSTVYGCFAVPDTFRQAAMENTKKRNRKQKEVEPWKRIACEYANAIYQRELALGKRFAKERAAEEIAGRLRRDDKLVTKTGKPITADYVVRTALSDWKPPELD